MLPANSPCPHEPCPTGARTVLVVEDDARSAKLVSMYLRDAGYGVTIAVDGEAALAQLDRCRPLAILLDILLPTIDGWEVLTRLKASSCSSDIPVVILSVLDRQLLGYELGAMDYLVKPVRRVQLLRAVRRCELRQKGKGKTHRILIVRTDPGRWVALVSMLYAKGYDVIEAVGSAEARHLAVSSRPDLVVLDIAFSSANEAAFIDDLRADTSVPAVPMLLLSNSKEANTVPIHAPEDSVLIFDAEASQAVVAIDQILERRTT